MGNEGKKFEQDFKDSIPESVFVQRLKDDTMKFKNVANICDYILYRYPTLYLLELKSHKGKSIPFDALREEQIEGLMRASKLKGVKAGFLFNFREVGETYFLFAEVVVSFMERGERKSFPLEFCRQVGKRLDGTKRRTRYRYAVDKFLDEI